jgi:hypothetical protein
MADPDPAASLGDHGDGRRADHLPPPGWSSEAGVGDLAGTQSGPRLRRFDRDGWEAADSLKGIGYADRNRCRLQGTAESDVGRTSKGSVSDAAETSA